MNDPRVTALIYRIEHSDSIDYSKAKPFYREERAFRLSVKDRQVRFDLHDDFATEEEARAAIAEYIHVWEFDAQLKRGPKSFRLKFYEAQIEDRKPTRGVAGISGVIHGGLKGDLDGIVQLLALDYPAPPSDIKLNSDVKTMHQRYMGYRQGREPLPSMAYFCLTMLEDPPSVSSQRRRVSKKRKAAAEKFRIDERVLAKIGHLSTSRGKVEARKGEGTVQPLSPQERHFLDGAVKAIIRRVAQKEHTPKSDLSKISWPDLPPLASEAELGQKTQK